MTTDLLEAPIAETAPLPPLPFKLHIDSPDCRASMTNGLPVFIDAETDEKDGFVGLAICWEPCNVYYFTSLAHENLQNILAICLLGGHNLKGDLHWLDKWGVRGISEDSLFYDTMLASYVQNPTRPTHSLKPLAKELLGLEWSSYKDMVGVGKKKVTLDMQPVNKVARYCGMDVWATYKLYRYFEQHLTSNQQRILKKLELPVSKALFEMERTGVTIDVTLLNKLKVKYNTYVDSAYNRINSMARGAVEGLQEDKIKDKEKTAYLKIKETGVLNPRSVPQKLLILKQYGFTGTSTKKSELVKWTQIPLAKSLVKFSGLSKLTSAFLNPLAALETLPLVHTTFSQVSEDKSDDDKSRGVKTGRLCVDPETFIEAPRDLIKYPEGIPLHQLKVGDWVYSLDWDKRLCLKKIKWVGPTGYKATLKITVKSRWDKLTSFSCSYDHLVRRIKGDWLPAGKLKVGYRLCGFVQRGIDDYARFFPCSLRRRKGTTGGKAKEHRWVAGAVKNTSLVSWMDVHHKDGNKLNNHPSNLEILSHNNRMRIHNTIPIQEVIEGAKNINGWNHHPRTLKRLIKKYKLFATNHTIVSIESQGNKMLWDLEIEDTHTFFGGEVALHNSAKLPNLQQIPNRNRRGQLLRQIFVPSKAENKLIVADYSQIELRLAAHFSSDPILTKAFNTGEDVHEATAKALQVGRFEGKTANFLLAFGGAEYRLSSALNIDIDQARAFKNKYWGTFGVFGAWKTRAINEARYNKGVITLAGRFIPVRGLDSPDFKERGRAERVAISCIIQGSAADIMKYALIELVKGNLCPILTVHDEFVFDLKETEVKTSMSEIERIMRDTTKIKVPLDISLGVGGNWANAKG